MSIYSTREAAKAVRKTKNLKGRLLCAVDLGPSAGPVMRTGHNKAHFNLVATAGFEILSRCALEEDVHGQ